MKLSSLVAGESASGRNLLQVRNPYNGALSGTVRMATRKDLDAAVAAARGFSQTLTRFQRAEILDKTRRTLEDRR